MQQRTFILAGAGALLLLASGSYAADPASTAPAVTSPEQIYLIRDNPFFNLHIEKAVNHAREAEIAGNMGESEVLLEHTKMSLMQAREAQRAGNVPGLNEGIANLKKALSPSTGSPQASTQPSSA
ncbi:MAG TPA: small metal-binding protein SmbP, partial [Nitrospira sp.]